MKSLKHEKHILELSGATFLRQQSMSCCCFLVGDSSGLESSFDVSLKVHRITTTGLQVVRHLRIVSLVYKTGEHCSTVMIKRSEGKNKNRKKACMFY